MFCCTNCYLWRLWMNEISSALIPSENTKLSYALCVFKLILQNRPIEKYVEKHKYEVGCFFLWCIYAASVSISLHYSSTAIKWWKDILVKISKMKKIEICVSYRSYRPLTQKWDTFNIHPCLFPIRGDLLLPMGNHKTLCELQPE